MAMFDQTDAGRVLNAELHATNYTAATTVSTRLGTSAPTATANMTELAGTGYTTGGTVMTFNAASAAATTQLEHGVVDERVGRHVVARRAGDLGERGDARCGTCSGRGPGSRSRVANTNAFQVAAAGVAISLVLFNVFASAVPAA